MRSDVLNDAQVLRFAQDDSIASFVILSEAKDLHGTDRSLFRLIQISYITQQGAIHRSFMVSHATLSSTIHRAHRALARTGPTVKAVLLLDHIGNAARADTALGTNCRALAASDAGVRDKETFQLYRWPVVPFLDMKRRQSHDRPPSSFRKNLFIVAWTTASGFSISTYPFKRDGDNKGGYEASDLRETLNTTILRRFPEELVKQMVPFPSGDLLRIPTEKEIFGGYEYCEDEGEDVTQWEAMKLRRNRIAFQGHNGAWEWYWLSSRLRSVHSATTAAIVNSDGNASLHGASNSCGVRPLFKIKNR